MSGFPADGYVASSTYGLTIGGTGGPSGSGGGFNLDADLGSFSNPGSNAQILNGEVTHSNANARTWTVDWTAPSSGSGNVTFDLTVNFVNGNGNTGGDGYGTDSWSLSEEASDSDGDGVLDSNDQCSNTQTNASVDPSGCAIIQNSVSEEDTSSKLQYYSPLNGKDAGL